MTTKQDPILTRPWRKSSRSSGGNDCVPGELGLVDEPEPFGRVAVAGAAVQFVACLDDRRLERGLIPSSETAPACRRAISACSRAIGI